RCKVTNLPWVVDEAVLSSTFAIPRVHLLNDLQAAAYGMLFLDDSELVSLTPGLTLDHKKSFAVIAAGTGLGEALLVWDGEKHIPMASEGGHTSFAPRTDVEYALLKFLQARHGQHVSWERLVAGPGLGAIYAFLKEHHAQHGGPLESPRVRDRIAAEDDGSVIGAEAIAGSDDLCVAVVDLFCALYGAEAGNLALKGLATGGVFVGGGVAPKLLPILQRSSFIENFRSKGRFRELLESVPVVVASNPKAPLIGAARFAARLS
ncbi:MAG TPA: glucokinase, partial [Myxococcota bacterium]